MGGSYVYTGLYYMTEISIVTIDYSLVKLRMNLKNLIRIKIS